MIQYREIDFKTAMRMIGNDETKNLFFKVGDTIAPVTDYKVLFEELKKKTYFRKEEINISNE